MVDWPTVKLGDVADILTGYPFKSANYSDERSEPRLLRGDNIAQGALRWENAKRWPEHLANEIAPYWLKLGDVVLAMDRPWIDAGLKYAAVGEADLPSLLVQRVARLRGTLTLSTRFLKYVIGSRDFTDYVLGVQTGTAVPHISGGQIKAYQFDLPSLAEQKMIADILGSLDDKIELNRRTNETLEAMAQAIFRDWFVDFGPTRRKLEGATDPVTIMGGLVTDPTRAQELADLFPATLGDGGLPEGWRDRPFTSFIDIVGGGTPKTSVPDYWGGNIPWFSVVDTPPAGAVFALATEKSVTELGVQESSTRIVRAGTTIISARGTVGNLAVAPQPMTFNQSCYGLQGRDGVGDWFVFLASQHVVERLRGMAHGSVFSTITRQTFDGVSSCRPSGEALAAFEATVGVLFEKIKASGYESRTLAATRDLLLPKLMSGEIRLGEAGELVEAMQ